jgi:hypothetical protein
MSKLELLESVWHEITNFLEGKSRINAEVFVNPTKYCVSIPVRNIVADSKISRDGINIYKQKIKNKEKITPIIVVKHPNRDLYAVLDGHHRFYAHLAMGKEEINCALAGDCSSVIFYMTEHGYFQPSSEITDGIRQPAIKLQRNIRQFLINFLGSLDEEIQVKNPEPSDCTTNDC